MKHIPSLATKLSKAALVVGLALAVIASSSAFADDATNPAASPAKHGLGLKFDFGNANAGTNNYHGLPKEAFDRLSPEQIMELVKSDEAPPSVAIIVPVAMFAMIAVAVALGVSQKKARNRMLHDTIRLMVEKGQPIPPELLQPQDMQRRRPSDLRYGLLFIGLGLGLAALLFSEQSARWPVALIPLLMGVAYLVTWKIESNKNGQPK
jgi:hypothetical protein